MISENQGEEIQGKVRKMVRDLLEVLHKEQLSVGISAMYFLITNHARACGVTKEQIIDDLVHVWNYEENQQ